MRKFIINTAFFFIPILVVAASLEIYIRNIPNPYKYKYNWMQEHSKDVELLVFGNSHTFYGINPDVMEKNAFSLANVSQRLQHDVYLLKYWLPRCSHLNTVVFPISYSTWFSPGIENSSESYRCRYYKMYMDCNLYTNILQDGFELSDVKSARGKLYRYLRGGQNIIGCNSKGWGNTYTLKKKNMQTWEDESEAIKSKYRHTINDNKYECIQIEMMNEVAYVCRNHHIKLVLVTTPCWHTYYNRLDSVQYIRMHELTHQFVNDNNAIYIDYMKDKRFGADDFYDSNHLSDEGATKFSKILKHDIDVIQ